MKHFLAKSIPAPCRRRWALLRSPPPPRPITSTASASISAATTTDDRDLRRVWVEPVYEERNTQVWVEPVYRTETVPVFVNEYFETKCDRVWVEPVYEVREVVRYEHGRRIHRPRARLRPPRRLADCRTQGLRPRP